MVAQDNWNIGWSVQQQGSILRSPEQGELLTALHAFQTAIGIIGEGSYNPFFKSTYADLADVFKIAVPKASEFGLSVSQHVTGTQDEPSLTSVLYHTSGQWQQSEAPLFLSKKESQGHGAAITYMRRYTYCAILGIVSDPDDDGNSASVPATAPAVKASGTTKKATTFAEAATQKKEGTVAPEAGVGPGEGPILLLQKVDIKNLAKELAPSTAAAAIKTFLGQQGRAVFGDGFTTYDRLCEGEAAVFISNLQAMKNGRAATQQAAPATKPEPELTPAIDQDTEEF